MKLSKSELRSLFSKAEAAGKAAGAAAVPTPMVVGTAIGFSNEIDRSKPTYFVPDGPCGFAWINIKPGNSAAARYAKEKYGARKDYYGGVSIWVHEYNQSMARKEAHAEAFAEVLREAGIKAYGRSRMD